MDIIQSTRIQTSLLNGVEKRALVWMAQRMPRWVNSDIMSFVGFLGACLICAGFILSNVHIGYLWLASFGLVVNWFGDSLDGTIARVRNAQRPIYGYYLDHILDGINEALMFIGAGLTPFVHNFGLAMLAYVFYLLLTLNVSINAHLRSEFKLTYMKLGPTEFRVIMILLNTILFFSQGLQSIDSHFTLMGQELHFGFLDFGAVGIILVLGLMFFADVIRDIKYYNRIDPPKQH